MRLRTITAAALACLAAALTAPAPAFAAAARILDSATGAPAREAYAVVDGTFARADASGAVQLPAGGGQVFVRAPGYRAATLSGGDLAAAGGVVKLAPFAPKALYLTVYGIGSRPLRDGALGLVRKGAANALVIDLKGDRGIVPYPSAAARSVGADARKVTTIPDLAELARSLHAQGVYLIGRIVVFKDDPLATARPDLAVKYADGRVFRDREHLAWVDPFQPQVRAYDIALAVEAARAGFDEIQFDYLRFPDSSAKFRLAEPSNARTRTAAIAAFLAQARQALAPYNVYVSADIFGYTCWNRDDTGIGQQIEAIAPNVDYLAPMLYPSGFQFGIPGVRNPVANSYAIVHNSLAEAQARLKVSPKRFRPWLEAFRDYAFDRRPFDADEVAEQIRAAEDFGSDGWMLWNAGNVYSAAGLARAARPAVSAASSSGASCS
jgi:hypothetical protein